MYEFWYFNFHRGHWHGDVAIKKLNITEDDSSEDYEAQLEEFKKEVITRNMAKKLDNWK